MKQVCIEFADLFFVNSLSNAFMRQKANDKMNVMRSLTSLSQGQGARPRPVGDTGSVSWRSGQRNRASEQREDFFGYHKRRGTTPLAWWWVVLLLLIFT